jgi:hypothetical protein
VFKWFLYLNEDSVLGSIKTLMNSEKLFEIVHQFWFYLTLCAMNLPVFRPLRDAAISKFLSQCS